MPKAMVVAPQALAADVGLEILKAGGNCVDAAIASAFVAGVIDPGHGGISGFCCAAVAMPGMKRTLSANFHNCAPKAATPDMWADLIVSETDSGYGFIVKGNVNTIGYQSVGVPNFLNCVHELHTRFGTMKWSDLLQPAIEIAREGFHLTSAQERLFYYGGGVANLGTSNYVERLGFSTTGKKIFFTEDGKVPPPGALLRNVDLANTLGKIANEGIEVFYKGEIAEQIDTDMRKHGGLLRLEDLMTVKGVCGEPISTTYRGFRIESNLPPGGGLILCEMLNILENFDLKSLGHNSVEYVRVVSEAMKIATIDKDRLVGDPNFVDVPIAKLNSKSYGSEQAARIKAKERASVKRLGEQTHTTSVVVSDKNGGAVSLVQSLGLISGVITDGLGFVHNGVMAIFDPRPGHTGSIAPGKSRFTAVSPTLVFKEGQHAPYLTIGCGGGTHITMANLQVILNVVDFGMPILDAVIAPRFTILGNSIDLCHRMPRYIVKELKAQGYEINRNFLSYYNCGSVTAIMNDDGVITGAVDPAEDGAMMETGG